MQYNSHQKSNFVKKVPNNETGRLLCLSDVVVDGRQKPRVRAKDYFRGPKTILGPIKNPIIMQPTKRRSFIYASANLFGGGLHPSPIMVRKNGALENFGSFHLFGSHTSPLGYKKAYHPLHGAQKFAAGVKQFSEESFRPASC